MRLGGVMVEILFVCFARERERHCKADMTIIFLFAQKPDADLTHTADDADERKTTLRKHSARFRRVRVQRIAATAAHSTPSMNPAMLLLAAHAVLRGARPAAAFFVAPTPSRATLVRLHDAASAAAKSGRVSSAVKDEKVLDKTAKSC